MLDTPESLRSAEQAGPETGTNDSSDSSQGSLCQSPAVSDSPAVTPATWGQPGARGCRWAAAFTRPLYHLSFSMA